MRASETVPHMKNHPVCLWVRGNVSLWPGCLPVLVEETTGERLLWLPWVGVGMQWVFLCSTTFFLRLPCLGDGWYCSGIWAQQVLLVGDCRSVRIVDARKTHQSVVSLRGLFPESTVALTRSPCCLGVLCCPLLSIPLILGPHQTHAVHFPQNSKSL